jgi:hypothetical protein
MEMVSKDALEYLVELGRKHVAEPLEREYGGRKYINKELKPIETPMVTALKISTLGSLIELCSKAFEAFDAGTHVVHVVDEECVQVVALVSDPWAHRETLIDCNLPQTVGFQFGQYLSHEGFIVGVLSNFKHTEDRDYILRIASSLTAEKVVTSDDDGISQGVGLKAGVTLKTQETLRNRVKLAPYRTFREVHQPISEFVFRVKQPGDNQIPTLALHEADGGAWKLEAVENVARFLSAGLKDATVVS